MMTPDGDDPLRRGACREFCPGAHPCESELIRLLLGRRTALQKYVLIGFGGGLGSVLRYWVGSTVGGRFGVRFPFATLVVNLTACLVIGFSLTWFGERAEISAA